MSNKKTNFPYEFRDIEPHEKEELAKLFKEEMPDTNEYLRVGPKGYLVTKKFETMASDIYNMEVRPTDIFVATYQRSGTTLTQELVWLVANKFDFETAKSIPLVKRYPFLDIAMRFSEALVDLHIKVSDNKDAAKQMMSVIATPATEKLPHLPDPRFIKTHLPMSLLPPQLLDTAKVVYVARDPRDVIVSSYHHIRLFKEPFGFKGTFKQFWDIFRKDLFTLNPYFDHVKEAWALKHYPNMLFLFYEDITQNLPASICRVADFLDKDITNEDIAALCEHLNIENFRKNKSVNFEEMRNIGGLAATETFIRNGKTGGWRNYFDEEMAMELQQWLDENLQGTNLEFPSLTK